MSYSYGNGRSEEASHWTSEGEHGKYQKLSDEAEGSSRIPESLIPEELKPMENVSISSMRESPFILQPQGAYQAEGGSNLATAAWGEASGAPEGYQSAERDYGLERNITVRQGSLHDGHEFEPSASFSPGRAPEPSNLTVDEIAAIFGRKPAVVALHWLLASNELQQAALAALLGARAERRSISVIGSKIPVPSYLRLLSRLCREAAEQTEQEETEQTEQEETEQTEQEETEQTEQEETEQTEQEEAVATPLAAPEMEYYAPPFGYAQEFEAETARPKGLYTDNPNEVVTTRTTPAPGDVANMLLSAWSDMTSTGARTLTYQFWAETGGGKYCFNWNLGNVKAKSSEPHMYLRNVWECASEMGANTQVAAAGGLARIATPDEIKKHGWRCPNVVVVFNPPHPQCRFRAYASLQDGSKRWLNLHQRIARANSAYLPALNSGDISAVAHALKQARYYTAGEDSYKNAMTLAQRKVDQAMGALV